MKIKDANTQDLNKAIKIAAMTAGLHNPPQQELIDNLLLPFIVSSYPHMELSEFNNAFVVYARQELEFKEKPFDLLSPPFIGSIIKSYSKYSQDKRKILKSKENGKMKELKQADIDYGKESFNFIKDTVINEGNMPIISDWKGAYDYAVRSGLINPEPTKDKLDIDLITKSNKKEYQRAKLMKENYHHLSSGITESGVMVGFYKKRLTEYFEL